MRLIQRFGISSAVTAFAIACSNGAMAVEGGVEDHATTHAVVVASGGPQTPSIRCSGTLISPNVVVTVRHCISELAPEPSVCKQSFSDPVGLPNDLWISALPWTGPSSSWTNVRSWVLPSVSNVCGNDIAVLILATEFTSTEASPARPVITENEFRKAISHRRLGLAGFGASSPDGTGGGVRRSRFDVPIRCVPGERAFECGGELEHVDVREFTGGAGPCTVAGPRARW